MERERITITIRKELLDQVDAVIDGTHVRNRSHAIESLLTQSLGSGIGTAVILAGGQGVNMRPFTYELPKSMIPIGGRPILEHILERLKEHHVHDVVILTGYLGDKIRTHVGDGARFGLQIRYVDEKKPLGTAGALRAARAQIGQAPFFVLHGDVLADINLTELAQFHTDHGRQATMSLTSVGDPTGYGAVRLSGTKIVAFHEKPSAEPSVSRLINAGIYVFESSVFDLIPSPTKNAPVFLEESVFGQLIGQAQLTGYTFDGAWFDISTPTEYERALKEWRTSG